MTGVANAAPAAVYQTYRSGACSYTVPNLPPGATCTVRLHFTEPSWTQAGQRQFNVSINGVQVLTNFDIFAMAGAEWQAVVETFSTEADVNGKVTIALTNGNASIPLICGIEVLVNTSIVAEPFFTPVAGTYNQAQTVTISCATSGATIRYTTNGTTPSSTLGTVYSSPVAVGATGTTLQAIAYLTGLSNSPVDSGVFNLQCATPTFSPAAGWYASAQTVSISTTTSGATIRYTTDGSTPTETAGTIYSNAVNIPANVNTTLQAIAYESGFTDSSINSGVYWLDTSYTLFGNATPGGVEESGAYELGVQFQSSMNGQITGLRVYRPATGGLSSYTATLWSASGTVLAQVTISAPTAGAWAQANFATPVDVTANTTYVASYSVTSGASWQYLSEGLSSQVTSGPLSTIVGANGVYNTTPGAFPTLTSASANYWADVCFQVNLMAAPTFNPAPGTYSAAQSVTIGTTTGGATIRYTTDGTTPSETVGTVYSNPVNISNPNTTTTLQAIAYEAGYTDSSITAGVYCIQVCATPTFTPAPGTYYAAQSVTISTTTNGATIRYTTNGTTPSSTVGTVYGSAVSISATSTLQAIAYETGFGNSAVASGAYTLQCVAPTFTPAAGTYGTPQSVTISTSTGGATIMYTTDGTTPSSSVGTAYSSPVCLGGVTTTLQAIAYENGMTTSAVTSGLYCGGYTFFGNTTPGGSANSGAYELGVQFQASTGGQVTALRVYRPATGGLSSYTATLWSASGTVLGQVTINAPTAGAWAQANLATPVTIAANTTYVASYSVTGGASWQYLPYGLSSQVTSGPLSTIVGNNGVYNSTPGAFPTLSSENANYYADVCFIGNIVAAPTFNPTAGTYSAAQSVTISTTTSGATIRYTTNGITPSETVGTLYSSAVSITANNTTLQAIAYESGMFDSMITSGVYFMQCATPTFNPVAGFYGSPQSVSISTTTGGATIRYTTDGTTPTETTGTVYSSAVYISTANTTTLQAIAYESGLPDSTVASGLYAAGYTFFSNTTPGGIEESGTYELGVQFQSSTGEQITALRVYRPATGGLSSYTSTLWSASGTVLGQVTINAPTAGAWAQANLATPVTISANTTYVASYSVTGGASWQYLSEGLATQVTSGPLSTIVGNNGVYNTTAGAFPTLSSASANYWADVCFNADIVAAPTFTPVAGTYSSAPSVTISTTTGGATIRYTTNGTTPSETVGTVYSSAVSITATSTLQALAYETGMFDSPVTTGVYTITQCATPTFNPVAGTFTTSTAVAISTATGGAAIRYTTNGTTPSSTVGTVYSSAVSITATATLQAIAYESGYTNSSVASGVYTIQCATPTYSPAAGTYNAAQTVTISTTTSGASIRYTTNGTTPSSTVGTVYSSPVSITATSTTLKAIAYKTGLTNSSVASGTYTLQCATPTYTPAAGTFTTSTSVTISTTTGGASIRYTTNGTAPSSTVGTVYSSAVSLTATATLKAIAYETNYTSSTVASGTYTIQCAVPTFNPAAGSYTSATVTISTTSGGASIRYTTNGTTPSSTVGTVYSSPVAISATETLQAIAYETGLTNSAVTSGAYTMYIGTTTAGGTNTAITANEMRGTRFQAGSAITINHIKLDIGTSVAGNIQCAIYSDSSGVPGTLLMGTGALSNPGTGWKTFTLTSSQALTSGTYYWLLFWSAANYSVENTTASGSSWYGSLTYGSWPSSAGSGTTETRTWSIYGY